MTGLLLVATVLLVLAFAFLLIDLFIPSGGILLVLSACCGLASVLVAFRLGFSTGLTFSILVLCSIPLMVWFFLQVWPHTSVGKKMMGTLPEAQTFQWSTSNNVQNVQSLIGRFGKSLTEMVPSGLVEIDGKRFDSLSEGKPIDAGRTVRVLRLDVGRLVVVESDSPIETTVSSSETNPVDLNAVDLDPGVRQSGELVGSVQESEFSNPTSVPTPKVIAKTSLLDQPVEEFGLESLNDEK